MVEGDGAGEKGVSATQLSPDLYGLAVEMADRTASRRGSANALFVTLHTGLIASLAFVRPRRVVSTGVKPRITEDHFGLVAIAVTGIALAAAWFVLIQSYRRLSAAKFAVIHELETELPRKIFTREWELLKGQGTRSPGYAELSVVEQLVPAVLLALYVVALIRYA